jgi:hypothetical protein
LRQRAGGDAPDSRICAGDDGVLAEEFHAVVVFDARRVAHVS